VDTKKAVVGSGGNFVKKFDLAPDRDADRRIADLRARESGRLK